MDRARLLRIAAFASLAMLGACDAARQMDASLRRFDMLDRVLRPRPPDAPVIAASVVVPPTVLDGARKDGAVEAVPTADLAPPAAPVPEPAAPPVAAAPGAAPVDPALRRAALLRKNPWLTRFWAELTPDQRARAARRLPRQETAAAWDRLGLADRVALVFGDRG